MSGFVCPHGVHMHSSDPSRRCVTCDAAQRAVIDQIIAKPRRTLVQELQKQLASDVEVGMSFEEDSPEDHYWRGIVIGMKKAIEITEQYKKNRVAEIAAGQNQMNYTMNGGGQ